MTGGTDRQGGGNGPVVVLMHGFGAPGDDLVNLWRMLDVPEETRFVFPAAPLSLNLGFGESRAWWMLDMERLARERESGRWDELSKEVPTGLEAAHQKGVAFLDELEERFQVTPEQILFGGFSQGAMLACDIVLRNGRPFAGLVLMSGTFIARDEWIPLISNRKGLQAFQSHGSDDPILSFNAALKLRDALLSGGLNLEWIEFRGGHEIPFRVLEQLGVFIRKVLYKDKS